MKRAPVCLLSISWMLSIACGPGHGNATVEPPPPAPPAADAQPGPSKAADDGATPEEPPEITYRLRGVVSAVDRDLGLVILSVGSDDGVEEGDQADVFRGKERIGRVVVERLLDDMSGARVRKRTRKLEPGDDVRFLPAPKAEGLARRAEDARPEPLKKAEDGATPGESPNRGCRLRGVVSAVDSELGLAILSVGSGDGVEKGDEAEVFRGKERIARVVVERVLEDMSGVRVKGGSGKLEPGDEVRFP